jgi:hypothetical protein
MQSECLVQLHSLKVVAAAHNDPTLPLRMKRPAILLVIIVKQAILCREPIEAVVKCEDVTAV